MTFAYRTGFKDRKDANHFKPERLNAAKKKNGSGSHNKEVCQSDDTSSNSSLRHSGLQSLIPDDSNILQSNTSPDACRDCCVATKSELVEILEFTHFFEHCTFDKTDYSERGKHMKKYIRVVVAVDLVTVATKTGTTS